MSIKASFFGAFFGAVLLLGASITPSSAYVLYPTSSPGKWGPAAFGTGATVTWSLMGDGVDLSGESAGISVALSSFMPTGFETAVMGAFDAWAAIADLTFLQVTDFGEAFNAPQQSGDIRLGGHAFDGQNGVLAHAYLAPSNGISAAGDIHFDTAENWKIGFSGAGFDIFQITAHEIGHAIGLDHTTVAASLMNQFYTEAFSGPQADDIAGAQFIYGANLSAVPLPAALPLFGSAIAMIGFVGLRRKRKATV